MRNARAYIIIVAEGASPKKKTLRYLCAVVFLAICVGLIAFMREFTIAGPTAYYADWTTSEIVTAGGAASFDQYSGQPEISEGEHLRFTTSLPEGRDDGSYLLIETSGGYVRIIVDGETVFSSYTAPSEAVNVATVNLPLPAGGGETLVLEIEPEEELSIFPPLLRLTGDPNDNLGTLAYANYYSFPAGAFALATAIICGLFLLELSEGRFQWKLLPLLAASIGLTLNPIAIGYGSAFLPRELYEALTWNGLPWLIALSALLYLVLHREKQFWLGLGFAAAVTLAVLIIGWAFSALTGGYLAKYMSSLATELGSGYYDGALTWLTRWLVAVSAFLGVRELVLYLVRTRSESRALALKDELVMQNYRAV